MRPVVSIYCMTYNHEKYIKDCLDGFIMQETDFPFEVIVHDDASTDNTQQIIKEYENRYPDIIKPIYQKQNQRKLKVSVVANHIFPKVKGKYVAICEGDDFWTDKEKLKMQVSMLEAHPDCHFCVCGVQEVSLNKQPLGCYHPNTTILDEVISSNDLIRYASQYAFQTSSYMMRYEDWVKYITDPPKFKQISDLGDITMMLYFGSLGNTAYVDRIMSCYRRGAQDSYSAQKLHWSEDRRIQHFEKQIKVWKTFDDYTGKRFHGICISKISDMIFGDFLLNYRAKDFFEKENIEYFYSYRFSKRVFVLFACVFKKTAKNKYLITLKKREQEQELIWNRK